MRKIMILIFPLLMSCCSVSHKGKQQIRTTCTDSIFLQLDDNALSVIREFEQSYPQYKELLIVPCDHLIENDESKNYKNGYLIGPAGKNGIAEGYNAVLHPYNSDIYVKIYQKSLFKSTDKKIKNLNPSDSVMLVKGYYYKAGWEYYILKSWLVYYDSQRQMVVNKRPDTLFLPKVILFDDIKYEPTRE